VALQLVVEPSEALPHRAAAWLAETMADALAARGACAIALSGGSTPRPVYAALAAPPPDLAREIDWSRVEVYFADERAVPPDDRDSNFRLAMEALLARVPIPEAHIHRMAGEHRDLDAAAAAYDRQLPAALDVLVLGMGADGHTASLFPGSPALAERQRRVVAVEGPKPPHRRLTITPPVIAAARHVAVLVTGDEKAAMVARALDDDAPPASEIPVVLARHGVWVLDRAAAARLARPVP
jgi:6-phosphogluconolactonase